MNTNNINIITLAYIGDAVYEVYMREKCIKNGLAKVEELQKHVTNYVSAKGQVEVLNTLLKKNILTEEEIAIIKRGKNNKRSTHPKHTDIATYKQATGFEALIGHLYLSNKLDRLNQILNTIEVK